MRKRFFGVNVLLACMVMCCSWHSASAQAKPVKKDTTIILINNITMQIEISQALSDLYNFKFERAEQQFRWFKQKYTWHPLPYFLLGLSEWWKIMPNTKNTQYDDRFLAYMDSTIVVAKNLFEEYPEYKIEVRPDILREKDGPTLEHAIQALHGQSIFLPHKTALRPDPKLLLKRYDQFRESSRLA